MAMGRKHVLRIAIDATPMVVSPRTGIENYSTSVVKEIVLLGAELEDVEILVYLHAGNPFASEMLVRQVSDWLQEAGVLYRVYRPRRGYGCALSFYSVLDRLHLLHELRNTQPWVKLCPQMITVYDVYTVEAVLGKDLVYSVKLTPSERKAVRAAEGLITISNSVCEDLRAELNLPDELPTRVIYCGIDSRFFADKGHIQAMPQKYGLSDYILFVGSLEYHKNVPRLVEAFARLRDEYGIAHKLVLAGKERGAAALVHKTVEERGVEEEVAFLGYVPDEDLPGLYAEADVFTLPSLHEGFGIPLLEAMASETVVVTSNLFSIPEVAGDATIYVDPYDVEDIAHGLWRAIRDDELREKLIEKGRVRARKFTWRQAAVETVEFYRRILG
jgi:glycosyltransferase involved in cell wall biosynthesis